MVIEDTFPSAVELPEPDTEPPSFPLLQAVRNKPMATIVNMLKKTDLVVVCLVHYFLLSFKMIVIGSSLLRLLPPFAKV